MLGIERAHELNTEQRIFARQEDDRMQLIDALEKYKPDVLLGVTAVGGLFTEKLIRTMAANVERPIIFPLSNPTTKAECTAEQAYEWYVRLLLITLDKCVHVDHGTNISLSPAMEP